MGSGTRTWWTEARDVTVNIGSCGVRRVFGISRSQSSFLPPRQTTVHALVSSST